MTIPREVIEFLREHNFVVVSSVDNAGTVHNSCKGVVRIEPDGVVYLLDLYLRRTFRNLRANPSISLTAVEEHSFSGYCLKGHARIIGKADADPEIVGEWERKISERISQRLVRNIRGEKGHGGHPEAKLPDPQYIIAVDVEEIVDLTPEHLKT